MSPHQAAARAGAVLCALLAACSGPSHAVSIKTLAASYLAIARPANHRLDVEVGRYDRSRRASLVVARAALRSEAVTEATFDRQLLTIRFPPRIAATARALVRANEYRIALTERQARSSSLAGLASLTASHKAADAAVEVQVRIIRAELGLPPPQTS
ncbi:MAG TPA: hypothetical protein VF834_01145 [Streptosporangiaceae bacterium]